MNVSDVHRFLLVVVKLLSLSTHRVNLNKNSFLYGEILIFLFNIFVTLTKYYILIFPPEDQIGSLYSFKKTSVKRVKICK